MKTCREFRKQIASLRVDRGTDPEVDNHLRQCADCRTYAAEISALCNAHEARAADLPHVDAPARLRQTVATAVNEASGTAWFYASFQKALAGAAVAALVVAVVMLWNKQPASTPVEVAPSTAAERREIEPSYGAYRNAFSRSADGLEIALERSHVGGAHDDEVYRISTVVVNLH